MHPETYKTFKALGIFLWYPEEEWLAGVGELCDLIEREQLLVADDVAALRAFANELRSGDLFDTQERYVDAFDRVRSLSLHLFEHVHGESRDRGQAMVDLAEIYKEKGFVLAKSELPDFLPVFLEFLSSLPKDEALEMLSEPAHVLVALGKRMAERSSPYATVLNCLIRLAGRQPEKIERMLSAAMPTFAQLDKEWEEKPIEFLGAEAPEAAAAAGGGCGGGSGGSSCSSVGCGGGSMAVPPAQKMTQGV